jgi:hypothetical protein
MQRDFNKIFCIGLNKTGTTSLHYALEELGFKSMHHAPNRGEASMTEHIAMAQKIVVEMEEARKNKQPMLRGYEYYDAFIDIRHVIEYFELVDKQYPDSKFIYTCRDMDAWINSRIRHVERNRKNHAKGLYPGKFLDIDIDGWKKYRNNFENRVRAYFKDRPKDLLWLDIPSGQGWEKLCPFLGLPVRYDPFPWENKVRQ